MEPNIITKNFLNRAKSGECVYITDVQKAYDKLKNPNRILCVLDLLEEGQQRQFEINIPTLKELENSGIEFVNNYVYSRIYNILSTLGGRKMTLYIDESQNELKDLANSLDKIFCINMDRSQRKMYGRCINVIDRMIDNLSNDDVKKGFHFVINDSSLIPKKNTKTKEKKPKKISAVNIFKNASQNLCNKTICGIDIGGTDIKIAVAVDGNISCFKEYDWFPSRYITISELIDPIILLVRLMRAKVSFDYYGGKQPEVLARYLSKAMKKGASNKSILEAVMKTENFFKYKMRNFDAIGLCFPDVVVKNKIVGGEVYKTRGIRNNPGIDYEKEFKKLTDLDDILKEFCTEGGIVTIINDGPMASFTAAVEIAASPNFKKVENGVFAHTLGTELGTGWVDENGRIPEIPLEVYNYIIDLGNYPEKEFEPDELRSINNFNTGITGTLQKYTSQSGVFRLAIKYFKDNRPDLYKEIIDKGFIIEKEVNNKSGLYVPTEPLDLRKPFLTHLMSLPERENCEICNRIFKEIGEFLAVTWLETENILKNTPKSRILFGRLVKNQYCFGLMVKGAKIIKPDIEMFIADDTLANTELMKQLKENKEYTVAQFAQSVGAIYYANYGLIKESKKPVKY